LRIITLDVVLLNLSPSASNCDENAIWHINNSDIDQAVKIRGFIFVFSVPLTGTNPAKPEAKSGTLFRQPQLDRETRSQTGHPAFKEYPTRLPGFS
jgi:hypothetical protein